VNAFEWTAWLPMLLLIVALGIFPGVLFRVTDGAVTHMVSAMSHAVSSA
jgi:NADH:ubiquinone oxidoreductase subunit 4 (subunit M)